MAEKLSLRDWLSDAEYDWRAKLKPVNLVIETDFTAEEIDETKRKWGQAARQLLLRDLSYSDVVKRFPALTLLILVGHASLYYEEGRFWDSFWTDVGLPHNQDFERVLRHSIAELLAKFSLARFPEIEKESGRKYVMLLALHAGIPVHCLRDLLDMINEHIVHGRPANGAALLSWLDEPGKSYRYDSLDIPVRNFFKHGAEFAVDILDRIIEFVSAAGDDPGLLDAELDSSTTGLPVVLLAELIDQLHNKQVRWTSNPREGAIAQKRPILRYDVDDDEIFIALPFPSAGAEEPWRVSLDGDVRDVHCARQWGASAEASTTRASVSAPVREVVLVHGPSDTSAVLPVVDKQDPLLTFSTDGQLIPRRDGLKDAVWVIYPGDNELIDPVSGNVVELQNEGTPAGWRGWRSAFIGLDTVDALQLRWQGELVGTHRMVRKDARPHFEVGEPVLGIRSSDGRPVHATRPWVMLPATKSDPPPIWRVRARRLGHTEWITDEAWNAEDVETCVDPFDDSEEPQLGLFEIVVSGPLGADARLVIFLAEGIWMESDVSIRVPVPAGLTACSVAFGADALITKPSGTIEFGADRIEASIEVASDDHVERISIVPPYVEVRAGDVGSAAMWRVIAPMAAPEELADDRFVAVRAPGAELEEFALLGSTGDRVQVGTRPRRKSGDVFELSTQQFADAARLQGSGRIVARLRTGDDVIDVTVLSIHPKQLGSRVELHEDLLKFDIAEEIQGLSTYVWCATAPWRPPEVLEINNGVAKLPPTLIDAGELRCQLFVDDPWVAIEPPRLPSRDAFRVPQLGWYEGGNATETRIARFLAGVGRLHDTVGSVPEAWAALAQLHADGHADRASGLVPILVENPRASLESLGNSSIELRDKMAMLMRSELVNHSYATDFTLNELHSDPWFGCMTEIADLPSLYNRRDEVPLERKETIEYLTDKGGEVLIELLSTGTVSPVGQACIDEVIFKMASAPTGDVETAVRERALVPRPLLHYDTRRIGSYEAFLRRREWLESGWSANFATRMELVLGPIKRASDKAFEAIALRRERIRGIDTGSHPWILMSVQSLTLAFLARLEACERLNGRYLDRGMLTVWTRLAELCPTMVATDLLMAEALTMYERRGNLIGSRA
ncbi:hypothetical protein BST36_27465 [Mycolicibacterium moriokaense]|uniref:Uncharacterized protein n=1 Tax=Mycolicibacterium moriokaense TaxID=39691 RepID=A0AAD1M876_9MYCO|nr:hypothetical protein [Mycolicibacterium moriokaense]ORB15321.1 hypothetical protein BST36_27465 [Mycolicibacterium moriokaense]BBX04652.1 hypothetical protein MMOR_55880 [Mycolicibacterium moriokaense]